MVVARPGEGLCWPGPDRRPVDATKPPHPRTGGGAAGSHLPRPKGRISAGRVGGLESNQASSDHGDLADVSPLPLTVLFPLSYARADGMCLHRPGGRVSACGQDTPGPMRAASRTMPGCASSSTSTSPASSSSASTRRTSRTPAGGGIRSRWSRGGTAARAGWVWAHGSVRRRRAPVWCGTRTMTQRVDEGGTTGEGRRLAPPIRRSAPPPIRERGAFSYAALMAEPAAPVCCGRGGAWAPPEGEPVVLGCMLCPRSDTYWAPGRREARLAELEAAKK